MNKHEKRVLAGMVFHSDKRSGWSSLLTPDHFTCLAYEEIYKVICKHQEKSMHDILTRLSMLDLGSGFDNNEFIDFCEFEGVFCDSNDSIEEVIRFKRYRDLQSLFNKIDPKDPNEEKIQELLKLVENGKQRDREFNNIYKGCLSVASEILTNKKEMTLKSGFKEWDDLVGGFRKGVYVLSGRPGAGKTTMAFQVAIETARNNPDIDVLFFSLEMSLRDCNYKVATHITEIPRYKMEFAAQNNTGKECKMARDDQAKFVEKLQDIHKNMVIYDDAGINTFTIENTIKEHEERTGRKVGLIAVDYIQIMSCNNPKIIDETARIQAISHEIRTLAKTKVPVLALAQLNRNTTAQDKPKLGDLKGSGQLEQDATAVFTLWQENEKIDLVHGGVIKNRYGKNENFIEFYFNKPISKFFECPQEKAQQLKSKT